MQKEVSFDEAMARKYPEAVAIAIARDHQGIFNPITLGWVMNTSIDPPMIAMSIGKGRYSLDVIRNAKEFVVSFPSSVMADEALFHGVHSGREMDKLAEFGTKTQPAVEIDSVLMVNAVANLECVLEGELETGDHVILVGRIVASHMSDDPGLKRLYSVGRDRLGGVTPD